MILMRCDKCRVEIEKSFDVLPQPGEICFFGIGIYPNGMDSMYNRPKIQLCPKCTEDLSKWLKVKS